MPREKPTQAQARPVQPFVRWLFGWYYRRVPEFFHQWPPSKSFRLLVDNYRHLSEVELPTERKISAMYSKEADKLRKELRDIKFRAEGHPREMVEAANRMFGTDFPVD